MSEVMKILDSMSEKERQSALKAFVFSNNDDTDFAKIVIKYPECYTYATQLNNNSFNHFMHRVIDQGVFNDPDNRLNFFKAIEKNFILSEENVWLIDYNPRVLEAAFNTNFKDTLRVITSYINNHNFSGNHREVFMEKCELYILEALEKNSYVIDDFYGELRLAIPDPKKALELSYDHNKLATIYEVLKYPYITSTKEFLRDKKIYEMIYNDNNFIMTTAIYKNLAYFISKEELENLVVKSCRRNSLYTVINGCGNDNPFMFDKIYPNKIQFIKKTLQVNVDYLNRSEKYSSAITNIINKFPSIIKDLLTEDYSVGLRVLGCAKIDKLNDSAMDVIKEELRKHNYVAGYIDNNIYLLKPMFIESLRNDFNATMRVVKSVYSTPSFYDEKISEHGEELRNIIINNISSQDCDGADSISEFIKRDPQILLEALRRNPLLTIKNMSKVNKPIYLGDFSVQERQEIEKILIDSGFSLSDDRNYLYLFMGSPFVFASLEKDYKATRDLIVEYKWILSDVKYSIEDYKRIVEICKKHDDEELLLHICGKNTYLLGELLKDNVKLGYKAIDLMQRPSPLNKEKYQYIMDIFNSLNGGKIDYKKHPNLSALLMWGRFREDISIEEQMKLAKAGVPVTYLKLQNKDLMAKFLTKEEMEWQEKLYFNSYKYEYNRNDELELLKFLNSQFDTVEDELAYLFSKKLQRKDLTPSQMLLFVMFMKKDQYNKGISGYNLRLYDYGEETTNLGVHYPGSKSICLYNGQAGNIGDLLRTIIHENNHAKQHLDSLNCDINSDKDIILYAKDELLRVWLMNMYQLDFYKENYFQTLLERDADLKAIMQTAKTLRVDPTSKEIDGKKISSLDEAFLAYGIERLNYDIKGTRTLAGVEYPLEELFERFLNICIKNQITNANTIIRKYPIVDYEYNLFMRPIRRKTLDELMINYMQGDTLEKDIIREVIRYRLDGLYNRDYLANIEEFERILTSNNITDNTLTELIIDARACNSKREINEHLDYSEKYLDYINYLINNDKRLSNDEFKYLIRK